MSLNKIKMIFGSPLEKIWPPLEEIWPLTELILPSNIGRKNLGKFPEKSRKFFSEKKPKKAAKIWRSLQAL